MKLNNTPMLNPTEMQAINTGQLIAPISAIIPDILSALFESWSFFVK